LKKGDKGGFERNKSPLTPLFQRGEFTFIIIPLRKRGKEGDLSFSFFSPFSNTRRKGDNEIVETQLAVSQR